MHPPTCERNRSQYHGYRGTRGAWGQVQYLSQNLGDRACGGELASLEKATKHQRTHPTGYYVLKRDPKVTDGQAVKPC